MIRVCRVAPRGLLRGYTPGAQKYEGAILPTLHRAFLLRVTDY